MAQIYIDDIVFGASLNDFALNFAEKMKKKNEMSMVCDLYFFLGLYTKQLKYDSFLSQSKYAKELLKIFALESTKHSKTPMSTTTKLCKDISKKNVEQKLYKSLLYLTVSHLDISFSVVACARYRENPKESHLTCVKRIIHYISGTLDCGLWYPYDSSCIIVGYSNANWAKNVEDRKNTFGAYIFVEDCLVA